MNIKIIRTNTNLYIVGEVQREGSKLIVKKPYDLFPTAEGISIFPMDKQILGKDIEEIVIDIDNIIYSEEPSEKIVKAYQEARSGIELL